MNRIIISLCIVALALLSESCKKVPYTDRNQLLLLPESTLVSMGLSNYTDFLDTMPLSSDLYSTNQVKQVGNNIAASVEDFMRNNEMSDRLKYFDWEFNLVEADIPNAWCMPGGKICFYTGILPYTQNESGIAVVMGHEIAHAVAQHGNERMTQQILIAGGGIALSEFLKTKPQQTQEIFLAAFSMGSELGIVLPYSRKHESEADRLGLIFMAMAGYNPEEAIAFWERMSENSSNVPEIISTHPSDKTRIDNLKELLPEAMKYYNN